MLWFTRIAAGVVFFMFALFALGCYVSRALPTDSYDLAYKGNYKVVVVQYADVPFVNGLGRAPGEVRLVDASQGRVLDSARIDDVRGFRATWWGNYTAHVMFKRGNVLRTIDLSIEPQD